MAHQRSSGGSSGGGGGGRTIDNFTTVVILVAGAALGIWIAWMVFHTELSMAYTYLRRAELGWLDYIGSLGVPGAAAVSQWFDKGCAASSLLGRCTRDFSTMSWGEISNLAFYANVMLLPINALLAFRIFSHIQSAHPSLLFSKTLTVDSFIRAKKRMYRHLRMFDSDLNLIGIPLDDPVLGMSQTSRQFAFHHRLIVDWIDEADGSCTPVLNRKAAEQVFRSQLGSVWAGIANLTPAETLLLAIAIPRVAATDSALDDKAFKACVKESDQMIDWCWDQFKPPKAHKKKGKGKEAAPSDDPLAWLLRPKIDLAKPQEMIRKYIERKPVQALLQKHAYVRTFMFAAFTAARSLGVLPPADMRWLRFYDRTLWYVLQNFGRQGVFAEGSAAHTHYLYEVKSGESLVEPQLDKAINALETALTAFKYKPSDRDNYRNGARDLHEAVPDELTQDAENNNKISQDTKKRA